MLDLIDRAIIATLKKDGRIRWGQLADIVGISRQALKRRIDYLEYKQHILGYTVITSQGGKDEKKRQDSQVRAFLKIRFAEGNDYFILTPTLSTYDNVIGAWAITGDWDTILMVRAETTEKLSEFREIIVKMGGIDEIETEVILNETLYDG